MYLPSFIRSLSTIEIQYGIEPTTRSKVIKNTSRAADLSIRPYVEIRNESFPVYICTLPYTGLFVVISRLNYFADIILKHSSVYHDVRRCFVNVHYLKKQRNWKSLSLKHQSRISLYFVSNLKQ